MNIQLKTLTLFLIIISTALFWTEAQSGRDAPTVFRPVTVLTYNIYGYRLIHDNRAASLITLIEGSNADIIALQEAKPWFQKRLMANRIISGKYTMSTGNVGATGSGLVILSRFPVLSSEYRDQPGRSHKAFLVTRVLIHGRIVPVVNVHLESELDESSVRKRQLRRIFKSVKNEKKAVVLGDFNFGDTAVEEPAVIPYDYTDLWNRLRPGDRGYTWNMERNVLARKHAYPRELSRRLDRILFHAGSWVPFDVTLYGTNLFRAGRRLLYPSDHFGLIGVMAMTP